MIRAAIPALLLVGTVCAMAQPAPTPAPAAPDYSKVEEISTDLGKGLYAITGSGGNTTVAVGSKGLIVVDTQYAPLYDKLRAKITSISPKPILYVVNTHYHADHTSGNAAFHQNNAGVILVAHPQVLERMRNPAPRPDGSPGAAVPAEALPTAPYSGNGTTLDVGGQTAQLVHPAPAHTDGDTILIFPAADVISTGDIVSSSTYPNIDVAAGGGIDGMIAGTDFVIAHADANTKIVPGHGHVMNKAEVQAYRDMLKTARDRIAKAKASGMTEDQVAKAGLLADLDKTWMAAGNPLVARFPINVYRSVK